MDRRSYLALLATGLAGCSATPGGAGSETPTLTPVPDITDTPTPRPTDRPDGPTVDRRLASVIDLETTGRTYALFPLSFHTADDGRLTLEFTATATRDHPALLRATLTNTNPWTNTFGLRDIPPFGRFSAEPPETAERDRTYRSALVCAPTERNELAGTAAAVERAADGHWRLASEPGAWASAFAKTHRLRPDESVTGEFAVVGRREGNGGGRPTGLYRFGREDEGFTVSVWETDAPGPAADSRFTVTPNGPPDGEHLSWFHNADSETGLFLEPSVERTGLPAKVAFTLVNHTRDPLGGNRYDWALYKWAEGRWYRIAPYAVPAPYTTLPPGGRESWTLAAFPNEGLPCRGAIDQGHLGGGTYVFRVALSRNGEGAMPAALFELDAPAVRVTPPTGRTLRRSGDALTVTTPRWRDGEHPASARITVDRRDALNPGSQQRVTHLVAEQVMRRPYDVFRDAFPYFDGGVERVVIRTDRHAVGDVVDYESMVRWFVIDGTPYRVTAELLEESTPEPGDGETATD